jgi:hypothetical protein
MTGGGCGLFAAKGSAYGLLLLVLPLLSEVWYTTTMMKAKGVEILKIS